MKNRKLFFLAIAICMIAVLAACMPTTDTIQPTPATNAVSEADLDFADTSEYCKIVGQVNEGTFMGVNCFGTAMGGDIYNGIVTLQGISYHCSGTNDNMVCQVPINVVLQATSAALSATPIPTVIAPPTTTPTISSCVLGSSPNAIWSETSEMTFMVEFVRNIGFEIKSLGKQDFVSIEHPDNLGNMYKIEMGPQSMTAISCLDTAGQMQVSWFQSRVYDVYRITANGVTAYTQITPNSVAIVNFEDIQNQTPANP